MTITSPSISEGDSGTKTLTFTVTSPNAVQGGFTVAYSTASGTAAAGSDYVAASGTLTFTPGASTRTFTVTVNGDTALEADETVLVNLSSAINAVIGDGQGIATITNDDAAPSCESLNRS